MEGSSRSFEAGMWSPWPCSVTSNSPPRRRYSTSLESTLMFIIFTSSHFHLALSRRDESITSPGTSGPWNKTLYKREQRCLDFHLENASSYFYLWPEEEFDHCCSVASIHETLLGDFTYGVRGPPLKHRLYYDLGLIDQCLPYWKVSCLLRRIYQDQLNLIYREFRDLRAFYKRRFLTKIVLKDGLLESALPFILFLEVLVMPFAALYWLIWGHSGYKFKHFLSRTTFRDWFRVTRKTLLVDWVHLSLLAVIGNGLLEATGRQDAYTPESESFYNYSLLYVALTLLIWISSFLQELSYWVSVIEDRSEYDVLPDQKSHLTRQTSESMRLKVKMGLDADWKLQPIGAQAGIVFCLWAFLTNAGSDGQALFGLVVAAAGPWSGVYALRVISVCVYFLVKLRLNIAEKRQHRQRLRRLWRRVIRMTKWGSRASEDAEITLTNVAQSEEPLSERQIV